MKKKLQLIIRYFDILLLLCVTILPIPPQLCSITISGFIFPNITASRSFNLTLDFSTYLGGREDDQGHSIAVMDKGYCFVTGLTESSNFPIKNAFDRTYNGMGDMFITKLSTDGSLLWSTFLGGSDRDIGFALDVDNDGNFFVTGATNSSNFPTQNGFNNTFSGYWDAFLAKFSSNGSLLWSTYFGGKGFDSVKGLAVAKDGSCYIIGQTNSYNFPVQNAFDSTFNGGGFDNYIAKFDWLGNLLWSTYLGGCCRESFGDIAVASDGSCFVTGGTDSANFPTKNAFDATFNGDTDVYITKFSADGSMLWSTFLGEMWWDEGHGIATTSDGSCYVTGFTSSNYFPVQNAYNNTYGDWGDAFVVKFSSSGSLIWSTFLGGNDPDRGYAITVSKDDSCYVAGITGSTNFPTKNAYDYTENGGYDIFATKFSSEGLLIWSTYLGGSQTDGGYDVAITINDGCFITGTTFSNDFPIQNAIDHFCAYGECFVTKFIEPFQPSTQPSTQPIYLYGFFVFMVIILLVVFILYIKRK